MSDERQVWLAREFPPDSLMHQDIRERFLAKVGVVADATSCWRWLAARMPAGYGVIGIGCRPTLAHRVSWAVANGRDVPSGKEVMHRCDNPSCVRPSHLAPGSHLQNMRDMHAKGRARQTAFAAPGTIADRVIAARIAHPAATVAQLAGLVGTSPGMVTQTIRRARLRGHLPPSARPDRVRAREAA